MPQPWLQRFDDLILGRHSQTPDELDAGAQLLVTNLDGSEAFRAPLARHWRTDAEDPQVIWIRPITGEFQLENGIPAFNISIARRRGLHHTAVTLDEDGDVIMRLASGQNARLEPAHGDQLDQLQRWDTFYYLVLNDEERATLERLDFDYWDGRFA